MVKYMFFKSVSLNYRGTIAKIISKYVILLAFLVVSGLFFAESLANS